MAERRAQEDAPGRGLGGSLVAFGRKPDDVEAATAFEMPSDRTLAQIVAEADWRRN